MLYKYQKIPPLADPEDESPTGDKEPSKEEPPPEDTSTHPPLLIVTNDGEVGMPLIVFEYVCERHMPYGSKVIFSRQVSEEIPFYFTTANSNHI